VLEGFLSLWNIKVSLWVVIKVVGEINSKDGVIKETKAGETNKEVGETNHLLMEDGAINRKILEVGVTNNHQTWEDGVTSNHQTWEDGVTSNHQTWEDGVTSNHQTIIGAINTHQITDGVTTVLTTTDGEIIMVGDKISY
jgi:hypothetical protein